jgi:hypothetical protein
MSEPLDSNQYKGVPQEKAVRPEGMTEEAWQKMNLLWGMVQSLDNPPSAKVKEAAPGDNGMQAILSMTEGLIEAGEKLGMPSDKITSALQTILKPKGT